MRDRFIPYPFQNNLHRSPADDLEACLAGLVEIVNMPQPNPRNFKEWILAVFDSGIADIFLLPYNFKVWSYPAEMLSAKWVGVRVAVTDLKRVLHNLIHQKDDVSWGPNNTFRFPIHGGTGAIWKACAKSLPQQKVHFGNAVESIDLDRQLVTMSNGKIWKYDALLSTIPITELLRLANIDHFNELLVSGFK